MCRGDGMNEDRKVRDLNRPIEEWKAVLERFDRVEGLLKEILEELRKG